MKTFTAQMSVRRGRWRLYVITMGRWPEHCFGRALPVPTFTERADALSLLGFEPEPGAEWAWTEDTEIPDDPTSAVVLIAALTVRSWTGALS
ncbi:DUF6303 family protein [Streptomyces sp. SHP 1-2]|uniref:DUF6303 family protein n=1 Tax=Streptomyces sp. SHP 1-2 TaxID=2769489 RepID=UPI002237E6E3|nr:DUF6303 family protein [Streptomyces sp. SHP 1-2]